MRNRFSVMITLGVTIGLSLIACAVAAITGASNDTLVLVSEIGAAVGLVSVLFFQAITPVK